MSGLGIGDSALVKGGLTRAQIFQLLSKNQGDMMYPAWNQGGQGSAVTLTTVAVANRGQGVRMIVPKSGTLVSLAWYLGVAAGNYDLAVWDTGDALAANRTRLYALGSTAVPATPNAWVENNPNLAVKAGQHIDVELAFSDATTLTVGKYGNPNTNQSQLPANYLPGAVSALPKLAWQVTGHVPIPAGPLAEATCVVSNYIPLVIGRIA